MQSIPWYHTPFERRMWSETWEKTNQKTKNSVPITDTGMISQLAAQEDVILIICCEASNEN